MNAAPHITVFLGPSLPRAEAMNVLDARYLPPASFGDIYRLIGGETRVILLLDGVFHGRAPVWQREILCAIDAGIRVYGASSMGALRAAELGAHGMIGLGTIYTWYQTGVVDGDDEVALLHAGPERGHEPLTTPLINLRYNLHQAAARGIIDDHQAAALIRYLQGVPFWERSADLLWDAPVARSLDLSALCAFLADEAVDLKRRDALFALSEVARRERERAADLPLSLVPSRGLSYHDHQRWLERLFPASEGDPIPGKVIAERVLASPARRRVVRWSLAARFFAERAPHGPNGAADLSSLADEALLPALPEMDWEELLPVASRAIIARALPHVAAFCEDAGARPPQIERNDVEARLSGALARLGAMDNASLREPLINASWALHKGPVALGFATWSPAAELLSAIQARGIGRAVADRARREEAP